MALRILAVDDSRSMRGMVSYTLSGAGFEVIEAEDGLKALDLLATRDVDLIITDVNMPNMDGVTLIKHVRANSRYVGTPILVLTTESDGEAKSCGRAAGATGWIVKPFAPEKLLSVVNRVCPAVARNTPSPIRPLAPPATPKRAMDRCP